MSYTITVSEDRAPRIIFDTHDPDTAQVDRAFGDLSQMLIRKGIECPVDFWIGYDSEESGRFGKTFRMNGYTNHYGGALEASDADA